MNRNLILHIGLNKTGTTSIQRALAKNRNDLRALGLHYPETNEGNGSMFLHKVEVGGRAAQFWQELTALIDSLPRAGTVILSDEQCSSKFRDARLIGALYDRLAHRFNTMRVVVYLRRQDLHAASMFAQRLRTGLQVGPPDLASLASEMAPVYDYDALLARWATVFGEAAIMPRIYQRNCMPGGDVVRDFLELCGLDPEWVAQRSALHTNPSMNLEGQALLLDFGRWLRQQPASAQLDTAEWADLATMITRRCSGRGWRPSQPEAAAYLAQFADTNEAARKRWFPERATLFDTDMHDLPEAPQALPERPAVDTVFTIIADAMRVAQERTKASARKERRQHRQLKRSKRSARKAKKDS